MKRKHRRLTFWQLTFAMLLLVVCLVGFILSIALLHSEQHPNYGRPDSVAYTTQAVLQERSAELDAYLTHHDPVLPSVEIMHYERLDWSTREINAWLAAQQQELPAMHVSWLERNYNRLSDRYSYNLFHSRMSSTLFTIEQEQYFEGVADPMRSMHFFRDGRLIAELLPRAERDSKGHIHQQTAFSRVENESAETYGTIARNSPAWFGRILPVDESVEKTAYRIKNHPDLLFIEYGRDLTTTRSSLRYHELRPSTHRYWFDERVDNAWVRSEIRTTYRDELIPRFKVLTKVTQTSDWTNEAGMWMPMRISVHEKDESGKQMDRHYAVTDVTPLDDPLTLAQEMNTWLQLPNGIFRDGEMVEPLPEAIAPIQVSSPGFSKEHPQLSFVDDYTEVSEQRLLLLEQASLEPWPDYTLVPLDGASAEAWFSRLREADMQLRGMEIKSGTIRLSDSISTVNGVRIDISSKVVGVSTYSMNDTDLVKNYREINVRRPNPPTRIVESMQWHEWGYTTIPAPWLFELPERPGIENPLMPSFPERAFERYGRGVSTFGGYIARVFRVEENDDWFVLELARPVEYEVYRIRYWLDEQKDYTFFRRETFSSMDELETETPSVVSINEEFQRVNEVWLPFRTSVFSTDDAGTLQVQSVSVIESVTDVLFPEQ